MGLNKKFNGLAPVALPVLYCPPHTPDDVIPAIISDSSHSGRVSLNTLPCKKRMDSQLLHGIPHVSDPGLYDHEGKPTELLRATGFWMFPKWYDDLVPDAEAASDKKPIKGKGNA